MSKHHKESKLEHVNISFSLLNVLENNLAVANRVTFIHRIIIIGSHTFQDTCIGDIFEEDARTICDHFCYESLTGLFLCYSIYYIYILEGPEDVIIRHLKRVYNDNENKSYFKKGKILVAYHNIKQRFFDKWKAQSAQPPILLSSLDPDTGDEDTFLQVKICIRKLYKLCNSLRVSKPSPDDEKVYINDIGVITQAVEEFLPEYALLEFLIQSSYLLNLNVYVAQYDRLFTAYNGFNETVWPCASEVIPFDVFESQQEPITDLNKVQEDNDERGEDEI